MSEHNYEEELPLQPAEEVVRWLQEKRGELGTHLLLYQCAGRRVPLNGETREAAVLRCSACGGAAYAEKLKTEDCEKAVTAPFGFRHPETGEPVIAVQQSSCPLCGARVEVQHMRDGRREHWYQERTYVMTVERCGKQLALLGWIVEKKILRQRETGQLREELRPRPYQAYIFEKRKTVYLRGYDKPFGRVVLNGRWTQQKRCYDEWGDGYIYPWSERLLEGSGCEHSKLKTYLRAAGEDARPVSYLRLWQKRPAVENLVVQGAGRLLHELLRSEAKGRRYYTYHNCVPSLLELDWTERRPAQMLGLTREELRHCLAEKWDAETWRFYRVCREAGVRLALPEDLALCRKLGVSDAGRLLREGEPLLPAVRYLTRQKRPAWELLDYRRMAKEEGYDLALRQVRWPKDLKKAHDRLVAEREKRRQAERDAREREKNRRLAAAFRERYEALAWMAFSRDGLEIRPCASPEELEEEGRALSHCVSSYKEKHAEGRSAILFLRRSSAPGKPWYTLELDAKELQVLQNRGRCNCDRTEQVRQFEKAWLEHIRAAAKKKERRKMA